MSKRIYLYDTIENHENLLPMSFTRPIADFRIGILTIREKWEKALGEECGFYPVEYLRGKFGEIENPEDELLLIDATLLPDEELIGAIGGLKRGECIKEGEETVVYCGSLVEFKEDNGRPITYGKDISRLKYVFDIFLKNPEEIEKDFVVVTKGRKSLPLPNCTRMVGGRNENGLHPLLFIEEGAEIECVTVNVSHGPVYIGKHAMVMEGACVRGPLAICEHTEIRMGAKVYGGTTFGPYCKIGGEIDNTVIFGYSNKAHDGYLGNAVIGEWCNIGAGVNASNLKNDYSKIRIWNYRLQSFIRTDLQFCGLIMGDHSKVGINCMINTATVMGVGVNIHGSGFPRVFVPSFCEGSPASGFQPVGRKKFQDIADRVMSRRELEMSEEEKAMYDYIYDKTVKQV